jgi:hypothetical protein
MFAKRGCRLCNLASTSLSQQGSGLGGVHLAKGFARQRGFEEFAPLQDLPYFVACRSHEHGRQVRVNGTLPLRSIYKKLL